MLIKWLGHACFLFTFKNGKKVLIDPYDNTVGYEPVKEQPDIVLVTHDHYDHNYISDIEGEFKLLREEGEKEISDIKFKGMVLPHDEAYGAKRGNVVTFLINADGLNILHLADVGTVPGDDYFSQLPNIDVLMLPVGGVYTVDAKDAFAIMERIHPNITIPMHYMTANLKFSLKGVHEFMQLAGNEYDKSRLGNSVFEITADNLKKRSRIVVMEPSN